MLHPAALLTAEESRAADKAAIADGTPAETLMEKAAQAVTSVIMQNYAPCPCLVVCGKGNNGGDGRIVAELLAQHGWPVETAMIDDFHPGLLRDKALVVDAIFGTGLTRPVEDAAKNAIDAINAYGAPVVAVDIASGVNADDGSIMGTAIRATHTVTFVRPKPGQVLLPGKACTGTLHTADIGIDGRSIAPRHMLNLPAAWQRCFPGLNASSHKYSRGHAVVVGGGSSSAGAAKLAAVSALRAGAGLASVACPDEALPVYAAALTAVMTAPFKNARALAKLLGDERITGVLIGPGCGINAETRAQTTMIVKRGLPCVLDADALTVFRNNPKALFSLVQGPVIMTPHEGEFARVFRCKGSKPVRALNAASISKATIVLKGNDTVIASPDGRIAINIGAPLWLATAGSGDVLAGIITGLLAQGMPAFEAACAGVWLHSRAALHFGPGLIAEDLPNLLPTALKELVQ